MSRSHRKLESAGVVLGLLVFLSWVILQRECAGISHQGAIEELFSTEQSGVMVESEGTVTRVLSDDLEGSRHQRLIVRLSSGQTLLISHNIDIAPRVQGVSPGDDVAFRGQYEWNAKGGVIHWTHHDPGGNRPGGWIRHGGREYR